MDNPSNTDIMAAIALTSDYDRIALVNAEDGRTLSEDVINIFSPHVEGIFDRVGYAGQLNSYVDQLVIDDDKNKVFTLMDLERVVSELSTKSAYYVNYRISLNKKTLDYQTKYTRIASAEGSLIAMGTCDLSSQLSEFLSRLTSANRQAETANSVKNQFLNNLSHDIRTPLNGVMGMVEMAKRNITDVDKVSKYLENMTNESNHLQSLLNDVLDISSLEDNHVSIISRPLNLKLFADNCVSIVSNGLIGKGVNLTTEFCDFEHPYILGDELHLQKVIVSILDNAIKFTRDGDIIFFRIYEEDVDDKTVRVTFEIEDTGIGMRSEFIEHIFDPFAQEFKGVDTSHQGSGLGLTISKKLIDLMGGVISVKSTHGIGSKFTISMNFGIDEETEKTLSGRKSSSIDSLRGIKILVVEDDTINRTITQSILQAEGAETYTAETGEECLRMYADAEQGFFDVILMDILMPGMGGLEAAKAIRNMGRPDSTTIPIIATTGNAFEADIQKSDEAGMNAHLTKPVNAKVLTETILKFIGS
jgi:signal transduction histidine kinase/ActR/RegA family two-component response regulator